LFFYSAEQNVRTIFFDYICAKKRVTMDLYRYIKELLFIHDCVIIPGFGGFVTDYRPARINHESNTIVPPGKDIRFNRSLTHNDGLLISFISEQKGIGYVDSKRMVTGFVNEVNRKLEKGKRVVFEEVGTFYYDRYGNLQFEPDATSNFLPDSYGLYEFALTPLEEYDVEKRIRKKFADKEPSRTNVRRKVLWRVAIAVPLLVALVVIPLKTDLLKFRTNVSSLNPISNTDVVDSNTEQPEEAIQPEVIEEEIAGENQLEADNEIRQAALPEESDGVEEGTAAETIPSVEYYIIAGSFRILGNAERYKERLAGQGYSSTVMKQVNGLHRVTLNGYPTKEEAVSALAELRKDPSNKELWILRTN